MLAGVIFFAPKPGDRRFAQTQGLQQATQAPNAPSAAPGAESLAAPGELAVAPKTRVEALAASPRIKLDTPGAVRLDRAEGARLDDVSLKAYRETVDPNSPNIVLLSPAGAPDAYYAEAGFLAPAGESVVLPRPDTLWQADRETLTPQTPVTLSFDNGQGLVFHRQIAVDDRYMFTIKDSVENASDKPVALAPYALTARHGLPPTVNYAVLHEGFVGVIGDGGVAGIQI